MSCVTVCRLASLISSCSSCCTRPSLTQATLSPPNMALSYNVIDTARQGFDFRPKVHVGSFFCFFLIGIWADCKRRDGQLETTNYLSRFAQAEGVAVVTISPIVGAQTGPFHIPLHPPSSMNAIKGQRDDGRVGRNEAPFH